MTDAEIDREVTLFRQSLFSMAERLAEGDRLPYEEVRNEVDALVCLMEEAPAKKQPKIAYLVERYEALLRKLVN